MQRARRLDGTLVWFHLMLVVAGSSGVRKELGELL
jgi:hypothetical protein